MKAKRRTDASGPVISAATENGYGGDPEIINQYRRALDGERRYVQSLIAELDRAIRERDDATRRHERVAKALYDLIVKLGLADLEPEGNEVLTAAQEGVRSLDQRGLSMTLQRIRNGVRQHEVNESGREVAADHDQRSFDDSDGGIRGGTVDAGR
jgi:hypothetical protein